MKKVTKNARIADLESKLAVMQTQIDSLIECGHNHTRRLIALEPDNPFHGKLFEPEPKLKQLDQSVFSHPYVDDRFNYVALNADGQSVFFEQKPSVSVNLDIWVATGGSIMQMLKGYDTTDWQNSLIERGIAKELLDVDLSSELTGSELVRAMLERGDKWVLCLVANNSKNIDLDQEPDVVISHDENGFYIRDSYYNCALPISIKGEPLTASEVGL